MDNTINSEKKPARDYRPDFRIYHASAKGTGSALKMNLHPAHPSPEGDVEGCIMMRLAMQKTCGSLTGASRVYPTFDWENSICVKLDFSDLCKMLQVFRGEIESIEGDRGLFHRGPGYATRITMQHHLEAASGYSICVYRSKPGQDEDLSARIFLRPEEALGMSLAIENSMGFVCFGIPKVIPHDMSAYRETMRRQRDGVAA